MKKAAVIFFVFIYAFSTTGVSLEGFYCCGKLKSVKLRLAGDLNSSDGCCKTTYQSFKIKDTHIAAEQVAAPSLTYTHVYFYIADIKIPSLASAHALDRSNDHAPPLHNGIPLYISDCIYRI